MGLINSRLEDIQFKVSEWELGDPGKPDQSFSSHGNCASPPGHFLTVLKLMFGFSRLHSP